MNSIDPLETASKHSSGGISAPGSKNLISNLPPDMRSMSLEKRTPEGPRWGSALPNALCIFQRTRSWAFAAVSMSVKVKADTPRTPSFNSAFDMWHSSQVGHRCPAYAKPQAFGSARLGAL